MAFFMSSFSVIKSPEKAAARYIKILRNATHGHGTNKPGLVQENNRLIAAHNGDIPADISLLGYLYLLLLLVKSSDLRKYLSKGKS